MEQLYSDRLSYSSTLKPQTAWGAGRDGSDPDKEPCMSSCDTSVEGSAIGYHASSDDYNLLRRLQPS